MMSRTITECELCRGLLQESIEAHAATNAASIKALRREIYITATVSTTLIGVFISVLALIFERVI